MTLALRWGGASVGGGVGGGERARGGVARTMMARLMPVRVQAMFLCVVRKLLIPRRQS